MVQHALQKKCIERDITFCVGLYIEPSNYYYPRKKKAKTSPETETSGAKREYKKLL
jgi:hypothetical protein